MKRFQRLLLGSILISASMSFAAGEAPSSANSPQAIKPLTSTSPVSGQLQPEKPDYSQNAGGSKSTWAENYLGNFRLSPLGLLIGYFNVDLDFKVTDQLTLGPTATYWSITIGDTKAKATALGARGNWYFSGFHNDGAYVSSFVQYTTVSATQRSTVSDRELTASTSGVILTALAGYHWFWDSFNQSLGAGLGVSSFPDKVKVSDGNSDVDVSVRASRVGLAIEYMIGWTF